MKKIHLLALTLTFVATAFLSSCKKDQDATPAALKTNGIAASPTAGGSAVPFNLLTGTKGTLALTVGGVYQARNFHQGTVPSSVDTTQWSNPSGTYYYQLCDVHDGGNSGNYDFKFQGTATGDFVANTTKYDLYYIDKAFDSVTIDDVADAETTAGTLGINGWYTYVFAVHTVTAISGRTLILVGKSGEGCERSYKIKINSIYWNETPTGTPYPTNFPFFSFNYKQI